MNEDRAMAIQRKLSDLQEKYEERMQQYVQLNNDKELYMNNLKRQEMVLTKKVLNKTDLDTGKSVYKNQTERDIALQEEKDKDEIYVNYKKNYDEADKKIKIVSTDLDIIKFRASMAKKIADLEVARMMANTTTTINNI